jgi:hypothetical protein
MNQIAYKIGTALATGQSDYGPSDSGPSHPTEDNPTVDQKF